MIRLTYLSAYLVQVACSSRLQIVLDLYYTTVLPIELLIIYKPNKALQDCKNFTKLVQTELYKQNLYFVLCYSSFSGRMKFTLQDQ